MSIDHNRIKVADLEKNLPNKILTTNTSGELEFSDIYNDLDCTAEGKALDARQGKVLKDLVDNVNALLTSDNLNLDTIQELVDAIEIVQNSLNTILVNDLITGGTTKALTAEMGKILEDTKVDKVAGERLINAAEITKLGNQSGVNTGDETTATIKAKLGISILSGNNTGDQILPTTLPASDVYAWAKEPSKPTYTNSEVGLGNVDNTSDVNKPVSTAVQAALSSKEDKSNKNIANGYAGLGSDGKLLSSQLPSITISNTFVVASQAGMLALTVETGDVAVRTDLNKSFILKGTSPAVLADWQELLTPSDSVSTVFGRNGSVTAQTGDYTADQITETAARKFQTANQQTFNDATSSIQTQLNNKEASFAKNTAFNKNFGTTAGTVTEGNDSRINNGQTAYSWGNHVGLYPTYSGTGASGIWGIAITGNAATATALQTARTINGVSFNGSTNITVADATKLPLTGGAISGDLTVISASNNNSSITIKFPAGANATRGGLLFKGNDGTYNYKYAELIGGVENWSADDGYLGFRTTLATSLSEKMRLSARGTLEIGYNYTGQSGVLQDSLIVENRIGVGTKIPTEKVDVVGNVKATSFIGALTGNAVTATTLETARTINGVSFNGSANITVVDGTKLPLTGGTLTGALTGTSAAFSSSIQVGNNTSAAVAINVGAIRYRTVGNNSYVDMCMQTGASTYEWVNIMENNW